jgi:hypothetical protein
MKQNCSGWPWSRTDLGGPHGYWREHFLLAIGAILAFAVSADVSGISLDAVGVILMIAGAVGLLWSLVVAARHPSDSRHVVTDRVD